MEWEAVAAIVAVVALFLTISPLAVDFFKALCSRILRTIFPETDKCEVFGWSDLPYGPLHDCKSSSSYCKGTYHQEARTSWDLRYDKKPQHSSHKCWEPLMLMLFSRGWNSPHRRNRRVKKPKSLSPRSRYLRIDIEIFHVIRLFTLPGKINIDEIGGVLTAHLDPVCLQHFPGLTKKEAEHICIGYLPWYKEIIKVGGLTLPNPLVTVDDTNRGGWIFVAGLSKQQPIDTFFWPSVWENRLPQSFRKEGNLFPTERAFSRVESSMANLNIAFPDNESIKQAQSIFKRRAYRTWTYSMIEYVIGKSGLFREHLPPGGSRLKEEFLRMLDGRPWVASLSRDQCALGIDIFSRVWPITQEEAVLVEPVIRPLVQAVICGLYEVLHQKNMSVVFQLRRRAQIRSSVIYFS
jgi:hypothetical protein